jgi:hypothetical protein
MTGSGGGVSAEYVEISPLGREGMAFAKIVAAWSPVKPLVSILLVLQSQLGEVTQEGAAPCLMKERNAENEECR